jgi:hypothetical protein
MNPGPMDHNGNPARFAWLVRGWCVQPGPVCNSMNPGPMDHNGNQARSALHDVPRLQTRWRCVETLTRSGIYCVIPMVSKSKHGPERFAAATRPGV